MQPYLFPYIGYFQLIDVSDCFVIYDDVNFIKQGWISRNKLLINKSPTYFTVPLEKISSYQLICDTKIQQNQYSKWKSKFLKTVCQSYKKSPYYKEVYPIVEQVMNAHTETINQLAKNSIKADLNYLQLSTTIIDSSSIYNNAHLSSVSRVIDIC